jgi:hypothetical protein
MIGRRGFLSGVGAAFLCLNLGLRPVPAVARPVPAVRPGIYTITIGGAGLGLGEIGRCVSVPGDMGQIHVRCTGGGGGGGGGPA